MSNDNITTVDTTTTESENWQPPANIRPDMCAWVGEDGELDADEILRRHGYEKYSKIDQLFRAWIAAHPDKEPTENRLKLARKALFGDAIKGRPMIDDDDILRQIAKRYHERWLYDGTTSLAQIIGECVDKFIGEVPMVPRASIIARLQGKFEAKKDVLLVQQTGERDWQRVDELAEVIAMARRIEECWGVPFKMSVRPRMTDDLKET